MILAACWIELDYVRVLVEVWFGLKYSTLLGDEVGTDNLRGGRVAGALRKRARSAHCHELRREMLCTFQGSSPFNGRLLGNGTGRQEGTDARELLKSGSQREQEGREREREGWM